MKDFNLSQIFTQTPLLLIHTVIATFSFSSVLIFLRRNLPSASSLLTFFIGLIPGKHSEQQTRKFSDFISVPLTWTSTSPSFSHHYHHRRRRRHCFTMRSIFVATTFISWVTFVDVRMERLDQARLDTFRLRENKTNSKMTQPCQESSGHQNKKKQGIEEGFWSVLWKKEGRSSSKTAACFL